MCKILAQNIIIKDILKKKYDVHWISVRTIVTFYPLHVKTQDEYKAFSGYQEEKFELIEK